MNIITIKSHALFANTNVLHGVSLEMEVVKVAQRAAIVYRISSGQRPGM
jgi:hypothetical protein